MKRVFALMLVLVMVLALCGCGKKDIEIGGITIDTYKGEVSPAVITDREGNTVELTADELIEIHKSNEAKFNKYYSAADIVFTGTVESIKTNIVGGSLNYDSIQFEEGWEVRILHGSMDDLLADLDKGVKLEVSSQVWDCHIDVIVQGCIWNIQYNAPIAGNDDLLKTQITVVE